MGTAETASADIAAAEDPLCGFAPGYDEIQYFLLDDTVQAMYDVVNRASP